MNAFQVAAGMIAAAMTASPTVQRIELVNFRYAPKPIVLTAGRPTTLVFINRSNGGHDFTAPEFFSRSAITFGTAAGGKISLSGRSNYSITLVPRAGTYRVHCSHFLHSSFGMTDTIIVR